MSPSPGVLRPADLRQRLDRLPRLPLAHLPTPLQPLPRLAAELGGPPLWVKRDDLTGLAFGGNKVRHYEYLIAHIKRRGYDSVINVMDRHSNNARVAAAAANHAGLPYQLVVYNQVPGDLQGNQLIDHVLGARLHSCAGPAAEGTQLGSG